MAIYTRLSRDDIIQLLSQYEIGELVDFKGITEGVSNTNYLLITEDKSVQNKYILTLFERRFKLEELPYFVSLMEWLSSRGISCPVPIRMRSGGSLAALKEKPALIVSFLEGAGVLPRKITPEHLFELGRDTAKIHIGGSEFAHQRKNALSLSSWQEMISQINHRADEISHGLYELISEEYNYLAENWPNDLPEGAIHADLFPDNVFFDQKRKISGIIDFYFACNDFFAYDLAIIVNAWCFDERYRLQKDRVAALMQGYNDIRPLNFEEEQAFPILLRGAALRFLLTRSIDFLNPPQEAEITTKNPNEYLEKLKHFISLHDK